MATLQPARLVVEAASSSQDLQQRSEQASQTYLPGRLEAIGDREWLAPFYAKLGRGERLSIVALGGSVTASSYWHGMEIPAAASSSRSAELASGWPAILERILRQRAINVSITNAGVGGSSAEFAAVCLDSLLDSAAKPVDLVLVEYSINTDKRFFMESLIRVLASRHLPTLVVAYVPPVSRAFTAFLPDARAACMAATRRECSFNGWRMLPAAQLTSLANRTCLRWEGNPCLRMYDHLAEGSHDESALRHMDVFSHYRLPVVSTRSLPTSARQATCGTGAFESEQLAREAGGWVSDGMCPLDLVHEGWPHPSRRGQVRHDHAWGQRTRQCPHHAGTRAVSFRPPNAPIHSSVAPDRWCSQMWLRPGCCSCGVPILAGTRL